MYRLGPPKASVRRGRNSSGVGPWVTRWSEHDGQARAAVGDLDLTGSDLTGTELTSA